MKYWFELLQLFLLSRLKLDEAIHIILQTLSDADLQKGDCHHVANPMIIEII